jgi:hypothetical protein
VGLGAEGLREQTTTESTDDSCVPVVVDTISWVGWLTPVLIAPSIKRPLINSDPLRGGETFAYHPQDAKVSLSFCADSRENTNLSSSRSACLSAAGTVSSLSERSARRARSRGIFECVALISYSDD